MSGSVNGSGGGGMEKAADASPLSASMTLSDLLLLVLDSMRLSPGDGSGLTTPE